MPGADPDQGHHREHQQHQDLDRQQHPLQPGRDLNAAVADVGHGDDPQHADQKHPAAGRFRADAVRPEQQEHVLAGDLGQAGHDQDVGRDDGPAARPAGLGPERPGGPGERGAAVGVGLVQLAVADRGEQHGHEGHHGHDGRAEADHGHDEAQGGGEAVCGGRRRHAHDDAGDQPEGPGLEALVDLFLGRPHRFVSRGHTVAPL